MLLTVKELKKYIERMPEDALVGIMQLGTSEIKTLAPKRMLLLESGPKGYNSKMCVINNMGTHWNEEWAKENHAEYIGYVDSSDYKLHMK